MTIARYSSSTFHPTKILYAVLDSKKLHPYLSATDNSCLSRVSKFTYRFLCYHLHGQKNIAKVRKNLMLTSSELVTLKGIINAEKETFSIGTSIRTIDLGGESYKFIISKTEEKLEIYVIVNMNHSMRGTFKKLEYCFDINSEELFVLMYGEKSSIKASEIAYMMQFRENPLMSTFRQIINFDDGNVAFISPFCNAGDLCQFINARLELPTALQRDWSFLFTLKIFKGVALAVKQLHQEKVAHCDLKPENILLNFKGTNLEVKITDFGTSGLFNEDAKGGTVEYFPPEACQMFRDKLKPKISPDFDIYALGFILFTLSTRSLPPFMSDKRWRTQNVTADYFAKLDFIATLYANEEWTNQIYKSSSNPFGLPPVSSISNLVKDLIGPGPRMSIEEVIERIDTLI